MNDNLLDDLKDAQEFYALPDDEQSLDATASLRRVDQQEVDGSQVVLHGERDYNSYDAIPPLPVIGDDEARVIYGFDDDDQMDEYGRNRRPHGALVTTVVGLLSLVVLGGVITLIWRSAHDLPLNPFAPVPEETVEVVEEPPAKAEFYPKTIKAMMGKTFAQAAEDLSINEDTVGIKVRNGRVLVNERLPEGTEIDVFLLVRRSALRANRLAAALKGKRVASKSTGKERRFVDLTWVVKDAEGNVYFAVVENPGKVRPNDGSFGTLSGASGYVASPALVEALGGEDVLALQSGEWPSHLDGSYIEASAVL